MSYYFFKNIGIHLSYYYLEVKNSLRLYVWIQSCFETSQFKKPGNAKIFWSVFNQNFKNMNCKLYAWFKKKDMKLSRFNKLTKFIGCFRYVVNSATFKRDSELSFLLIMWHHNYHDLAKSQRFFLENFGVIQDYFLVIVLCHCAAQRSLPKQQRTELGSLFGLIF